MAACNLVIVMGNLGRDPDSRFTQSGAPVTTFSLACNRVWYDKNTKEKKEEVTWVRVVAWNKLAEHCTKYLERGRGVHVVGRLRSYEYEDKKSGEKRYGTDVIAERIQFLPKGEKKDGRPHPSEMDDGGPPEGIGDAYIPADPGEDDIPF